MPPPDQPNLRRRKDARPAEIVSAALDVFVDKGFAAARLDDIAAKAGVSKGAIYLYFGTKQDIFRAVVEQAIAPNVEAVKGAILAHPGPFPDLVALLVSRVAVLAETSAIGGVLKMVVGEARNFPELADFVEKGRGRPGRQGGRRGGRGASGGGQRRRRDKLGEFAQVLGGG